MRLALGLASHATARQSVIAQNIANANTPGYRARDVESFQQFFSDRTSTSMRATRAGHMGGLDAASSPVVTLDARAQASPDGNSVTLETEMMKQIAARQQHDKALAIYKHSLDMLRTAVGRGR
jgi:flagellar basal-body rod protein FlgB